MSLTTQKIGNALAPATFAEAKSFAEMIASTEMVPTAFRKKPADILVAMQWGSEIGLAPMQALQNIAVINGRPSLWGDAALAVARNHPSCESITEGVSGEGDAMVGWCKVKRRGEDAQTRTFSVDDAKRANLWNKAGPWQQYPKRMLQLRARGFAIRDCFPDALRGLITSEEAADMPAETLPPAAGPTINSVAEPAPVEPEPPTLIMLKPNGEQWHTQSVDMWVRACKRAIGLMENGDALGQWRVAMAPHMDAVSVVAEHAVIEVNAAAEVALDAFAEKEAAE